MERGNNVQEQLRHFRNEKKFSASEWDKRGLNPSDEATCLQLETFFNNYTDDLINTIESSVTHEVLTTILQSALTRIDAQMYDTEEREFIGDYIIKLANIIQVDIYYSN